MIIIYISNDGLEDLFVTVTDYNTNPISAVLSSVRLNNGSDPVPVQIQEDGSGKGDIVWMAVAASDTTRTKTSDHLHPVADDPIKVDIFGV